MRGIIMAGGAGTRLGALTRATSKQLLPVYDKPAIYYPLCTLMLAGIRDILVISTPRDVGPICRLLADGKRWGIRISYAEQEYPGGIAQAFTIGASHVAHHDVCLILGDNLFHSPNLGTLLQGCRAGHAGGRIFAKVVGDPRAYGVVELGDGDVPIGIEEKPAEPRSNLAVTGLYMYDSSVVGIAQGLRPSARGEVEITDVNKEYLRRGKLFCTVLGNDTVWMDVGTPNALIDAGVHVRALQNRTGERLGCPDQTAAVVGFIARVS